MSDPSGSVFRGWVEAGRKVALFLVLVIGSAALGAVVAWPLWRFATAARWAYTWFALGVAVAGIAAAVVRAAARRRRLPPDPSRPRHPALSLILSTLRAVLFLAGLYAVLVFAVRAFWGLAVAAAVVSAGLLWLLTLARRRARRGRRHGAPTAQVR